MKKLRDIAEALGRNTKPTVRTRKVRSWSLPKGLRKPGKEDSDYDVQRQREAEAAKAWDEYDKKLRESFLRELLQLGTTPLAKRSTGKSSLGTSKPKDPESSIKNRKALVKKNSVMEASRKAESILPKHETERMDREKKKTRERIDSLKKKLSEGVKKWRPGMTKRELDDLKASLRSPKPKGAPKKKPKPAPVKKPVAAPVADDKHPLEDILKNENKDVRARLMQVHPADRANAQNYIRKHGMAAFMRNADQFRRK